MTGLSTGWLETTHPGGRARAVRVHEAGGAPLVTRIDLTDDVGASHTVYSGGDQTGMGGWLVVPLPLTEYRVVKVKLWLAQGGGPSAGYIAVDAVGLDVQPEDRYQYNGFNQLLSVTGNDGTSTSFAYDGNGNQVRKQDASGVTQYVYNDDSRLVGIALPNGQSNAFEYDANGLRTKKTDSSGTSRYLLDGLSVVAQYAPSGERQAFYVQSLARIDEVLSVVNSAGKFWYQGDALGSVYTLTTAAGDVRARGGYDVFGEPVAEYGQQVGQPFGFTGREHELDSGLTYHRDRYMQVGVGRWTQPDRLASAVHGSEAASLFSSQLPLVGWQLSAQVGREVSMAIPVGNPYSYGYAPTRMTDPSGFLRLASADLACTKEDWMGIPLVFGELSFGPVSIVLFGGIYSNFGGQMIAVAAVFGEVGHFDEQILQPFVNPHPEPYLSFGFEYGIEMGAEYDTSEHDFADGGWFLEGVMQVGPVVFVTSSHGWSVFFTPKISAGAAALFGRGRWVSVTPVFR